MSSHNSIQDFWYTLRTDLPHVQILIVLNYFPLQVNKFSQCMNTQSLVPSYHSMNSFNVLVSNGICIVFHAVPSLWKIIPFECTCPSIIQDLLVELIFKMSLLLIYSVSQRIWCLFFVNSSHSIFSQQHSVLHANQQHTSPKW